MTVIGVRISKTNGEGYPRKNYTEDASAPESRRLDHSRVLP
jgi:hypothetical protein